MYFVDIIIQKVNLYVCQNVCRLWNSILRAEVTLYFKSVFMGFNVKVTEI